jgi:uncharacterized protein with ParB-like and HNH nuclease domain
MSAALEDSDLEIDPTEPSAEDEALPAPKYEIFSYPADTTLKGYKDQWNAKPTQLVVPEFQRDYVWDQVRASKLIESFLLGLPVPPVFLYRSQDKKAFLIIDGQQRIRSAVDFQNGMFKDAAFRLKGVAEKWAGKSFRDLNEADQFQIENAVLRGMIIQQTDPKDNKSIYQIFERLNTGGVRLNPMEVRNCVSHGEFLTELREVNKLLSWRKLLGLETPDKRFKDVELILRVLALHDNVDGYEKPMKGFLNDYSSKMSKEKFEEFKPLLENFKATCDAVLNQLGEKPFHLRGKLNFSVLDSVLVAVMKSPVPNDLKNKFAQLRADKDFESAYTYNTSDEGVLKPRIKKATEILG